MSCGVSHRRSSDPSLPWLWRRLEATAPIRPLAWEPPFAGGAAQEMAERQKKKKKERTKNTLKNKPEILKKLFLIQKWGTERSHE